MQKRSAWRALFTQERRFHEDGEDEKESIARGLRQKVELCISQRCTEIIGLIEDKLLPEVEKITDKHNRAIAEVNLHKM